VILGGAGGFNVTVAVAVLLVSATLVAVTVTVWTAAIVAGAVYNPVLDTVPAVVGLMLQLTCVFALPVTVAVNCCVCDPNRFAVPGPTLTTTDMV
jgi:hypothetical protein